MLSAIYATTSMYKTIHYITLSLSLRLSLHAEVIKVYFHFCTCFGITVCEPSACSVWNSNNNIFHSEKKPLCKISLHENTVNCPSYIRQFCFNKNVGKIESLSLYECYAYKVLCPFLPSFTWFCHCWKIIIRIIIQRCEKYIPSVLLIINFFSFTAFSWQST